jgi:hypothetical protein
MANNETCLYIQGQRVASNYQQIIREKSTINEVHNYYIPKYNWTDNEINNIHWRAHGKAIQTLTGRQYKTITQFIHSWLPINASYAQDLVGDGKLCPFCLSTNETHEHFLSCQHDNLQHA